MLFLPGMGGATTDQNKGKPKPACLAILAPGRKIRGVLLAPDAAFGGCSP
jgi:hypothetical protein